MIDDPHGLVNRDVYLNFLRQLFYDVIVEGLNSKYSDEDRQPIVSNILHEEIDNQDVVLSKIDEYRSWVDKFISNEMEHPLNGGITIQTNDSSNTYPKVQYLPGTICSTIETIRNQKKITSKFNPFKIADDIYFNGLNPTHELSGDELDLVEMVLDYHSRPKYDYRNRCFINDQYVDDKTGVTTYGSTKYAYYKELELLELIKMIMFVTNNLNRFGESVLSELTYDVSTNKYFQTQVSTNSLRVV